VYTSMSDEPQLNMWLTTKGVNGRILRDVSQIRRVISLLEPVWAVVKDRHNLENLLTTMDATSARKMAHLEMLSVIEELDYR